MKISTTLILLVVFSIASVDANALVSRICEEVISPFWKIHRTIEPPEKAPNNAPVFDFCHSNPHDFGATSVSPKKPKQLLHCYRSVDDEIVLEIPNIFFTDCRDAEYFETLLDHYAYKRASLSQTPFSMVIYNQKHKFLSRGQFDKNSDVFHQVAYRNYFVEKTQFLMRKIREGLYKPETISCLIESVDSLGEPCPKDFITRFPEPISISKNPMKNR